MPYLNRPSREQAATAIVDSTVLAVACLATYSLVTVLRHHVYSVSRADDLIGGLWAMISAIFVLRNSYQQSVAAAVSRLTATTVSFALCLVYLIFLPANAWSIAALIGLSTLAVLLLGRPGDAITAAISSAVVMVVAAVSPEHAWQQPILRLIDTIIGAAIGVAFAWADIRLIRPRLRPGPRSG
jgi:uncharacterized membrane protein YccC